MYRTSPQPFIDRPVATTLLTLGVALAGALAFRLLPVSPLPQVDFPDDLGAGVAARREPGDDGGDGRHAARALARPHRRRHRDDVEQRRSARRASRCSSTSSRDIDGAARDVQAAINAARALLPTGLPNNPTYRKVNPADAPIMILALTSDTMTQGQMYDAASTILAQKLSQVDGVGQVTVGGSSLPAVRVELNPQRAQQVRHRPRGRARGDRRGQRQPAQGRGRGRRPPLADRRQRPGEDRRRVPAADRRLPQRRARCGWPTSREVVDSVQDLRNAGMANGKPSVLLIINRQPNANIIETVDRVTGAAAAAARVDPERDRPQRRDGAHARRSARRCATSSARW